MDALLVALVAAAMGFVLTGVDSDPDLWGRMAYARLALAQGRLVSDVDPYSYTAAGGIWRDHEYGFNWIAWGFYSLGGWPGLRVLRLLLYFGTLGLSLAPAWKLARGSGVRLLYFALPAVALAPGFVGPRAQATSFILFAWLLFCLFRAEEHGPKWLLFGVLPLPLWANMHGGFLAGGGVACVWGGFKFVQALRRREWRTVGLIVLAGAVCLSSFFLTPWGPKYAPFILRTATMDRPYVPEWSAPPLLSANWWLVVVLVVGCAVAVWARPRRWAELAAVCVVIFAASRHQRHIPFLAIGVLVFAAPAVLKAWAARQTEPVTAPPRGAVLLMGSVLGAGVLALVGASVPNVLKGTPAEPLFPEKALAELQKRGLQGGLLVDFDWAQYVIFYQPPGVTVAFDGRYEEVYPDSVVDTFVAWNYGQPGWEALPNDARTRLALVANGSGRDTRLLSLPQWQRVYQDELASLFVKTDAAPAPPTAVGQPTP